MFSTALVRGIREGFRATIRAKHQAVLNRNDHNLCILQAAHKVVKSTTGRNTVGEQQKASWNAAPQARALGVSEGSERWIDVLE